MAIWHRKFDFDGDTIENSAFSVTRTLPIDPKSPQGTFGHCSTLQGQCQTGTIQEGDLKSFCEFGGNFPISEYIYYGFDETKELELQNAGLLSPEYVIANSHEIHKINVSEDGCTIESTSYLPQGSINRVQDIAQELISTWAPALITLLFIVFSVFYLYARFKIVIRNNS